MRTASASANAMKPVGSLSAQAAHAASAGQPVAQAADARTEGAAAKQPRTQAAPSGAAGMIAKRSAATLPVNISSEESLALHLAALGRLDPRFEAVAAVAGAVPLRRLEPGFKGLFWVITGQQISTSAARAIFARCEAALGSFSAECVAAADDALLKSAGLSTPKIRTLRAVTAAILAGEVALHSLAAMEAETAVAHLVGVKGIGPWTAQSYLLFALGHPDIFPAGDLALKEAARLAFGLPERPAEKAFAAMAEAWYPHRSAAARLLWAYYAAVKRGDGTPV